MNYIFGKWALIQTLSDGSSYWLCLLSELMHAVNVSVWSGQCYSEAVTVHSRLQTFLVDCSLPIYLVHCRLQVLWHCRLMHHMYAPGNILRQYWVASPMYLFTSKAIYFVNIEWPHQCTFLPQKVAMMKSSLGKSLEAYVIIIVPDIYSYLPTRVPQKQSQWM